MGRFKANSGIICEQILDGQYDKVIQFTNRRSCHGSIEPFMNYSYNIYKLDALVNCSSISLYFEFYIDMVHAAVYSRGLIVNFHPITDTDVS